LKVGAVAGFIASVERPRDLKLMTTEERVGIDLFVNGRLRVRLPIYIRILGRRTDSNNDVEQQDRQD
jgi:hypothetical protein